MINQLPGFESLSAEEVAALQSLARSNEWLRAALCTLARRGVAYRQANPLRAQALLSLLAPLPYYKAGQFLFDLLEWEDFMLDGPPPPLVATTLDQRALRRLISFLGEVQSHLDGSVPPDGRADWTAIPAPTATMADDELPPLEPGLYLYQDVVLGVVSSILSAPPARDVPPLAADSLRLSLSPAVVDVTPGQQDAVQVTLVNEGQRAAEFHLQVKGIPDGWYDLPAATLALNAGTQATVLLAVHPPRAAASRARRYPFEVIVTAAAQPELAIRASGTLIVQPFTALAVDIKPV